VCCGVVSARRIAGDAVEDPGRADRAHRIAHAASSYCPTIWSVSLTPNALVVPVEASNCRLARHFLLIATGLLCRRQAVIHDDTRVPPEPTPDRNLAL
jgi:hypothetical protein